MKNLPLFEQDELEDSVFDDLIFNNLNYSKKDLHDKSFYNCTFKKCTFLETILSECTFEKCIFTECDLSLAKFNHAAFIDGRFESSKMIGINWIHASSGLPLSVDFFKCILNYSVFMGLSLCKQNMIECTAKEVDFTDANLTGTKCNFTDFSGSRFLNTNLTQTDFSDAINYVIDPNHNKLKKTIFSIPEAMGLLRGFDIILK